MSINNVEITSKISDIASLIKDSKDWAAKQPGTSLDAHLATYINVCLLGVMEESIELLFRERAERSGDQCTANYIRLDLNQSFQNPKFNKINDVLSRFSPEYARIFRDKLSADSPEMTALNAINNIKQDIAHLGMYNLKLTIEDVENYFKRVIPILEVLEVILS